MLQYVYTYERICYAEHIKSMQSAFEIIAEPNRRAILSLLVSSQQSVGEIERQLRMPQPTVSKHLRVLRQAGFVESTAGAQRRLLITSLSEEADYGTDMLAKSGRLVLLVMRREPGGGR